MFMLKTKCDNTNMEALKMVPYQIRKCIFAGRPKTLHSAVQSLDLSSREPWAGAGWVGAAPRSRQLSVTSRQ